MRNILLVGLLALLCCGCSVEQTVDSLSRYEVQEIQSTSAEVVEVGKTLPATQLTHVTVLINNKPKTVFSLSNVSVGQRVDVVTIKVNRDDGVNLLMNLVVGLKK